MEAVPPSAGTGASIPCMEIPHRLIDVGAVMLVAAEPPQEPAVSATVISATAEAMRPRGIRLRTAGSRISRNGPGRADQRMRQSQKSGQSFPAARTPELVETRGNDGGGWSRSAARSQTYPDGYQPLSRRLPSLRCGNPISDQRESQGRRRRCLRTVLPEFPSHLAVCGPEACQKPSTKYKPAPAIPPMIGPTIGTQA